MKEETPIMGAFSPTLYTEVICYVKLMGEFSWKSYYDKVMGEFSPTKYTMQVLLC